MDAIHQFPEVELRTERLLLRAYRGEDALAVAEACRDELIQRCRWSLAARSW